MKLKLSHKLLASFLCTSLLTVVAMVVLMQIYATRDFTDYVNRVEMEKLSDLLDGLKEDYITHQGWEHLRQNFVLWQDLLRSRSHPGDLDLPLPPPPHPPPPPPHPPEEEFRGRERNFNMPGADLPKGPPLPPLPPPPRHNPFSIAARTSLFDEGQRLVVGNPSTPQEQVLKPIEVDGKTVGWLGIRKRTQLSRPLDVEFARQQTRVFFLTGVVALCVAALVSFLLAGHLLRPIRKLIQGTQALSERKFETRVAIASHDELGQLAADFNNMAQALDRYERMRRQWLSDISHELRTPLSILRAEIEAIQDGLRKITKESLESLHAEILHLGKIVNDLHDLSLADSAMLTIRKVPVKPLQILRSTLKSFETRFRERDITVQDDLESAEEVMLAGDENRLKQLFSNILENTLSYAECPGTLKIWHQYGSGELDLNFMDSGPGVPEGSLERLFDRLYRVDGSRNREHGGSGLGLAICKSIVEALGGEIKAANAPGKGLWIKIVFSLPSPK
jgi:two-component system, OmpR family, sensor histidine kinase BaeS